MPLKKVIKSNFSAFIKIIFIFHSTTKSPLYSMHSHHSGENLCIFLYHNIYIYIYSKVIFPPLISNHMISWIPQPHCVWPSHSFLDSSSPSANSVSHVASGKPCPGLCWTETPAARGNWVHHCYFPILWSSSLHFLKRDYGQGQAEKLLDSRSFIKISEAFNFRWLFNNLFEMCLNLMFHTWMGLIFLFQENVIIPSTIWCSWQSIHYGDSFSLT